jgi:hypothetical protein
MGFGVGLYEYDYEHAMGGEDAGTVWPACMLWP